MPPDDSGSRAAQGGPDHDDPTESLGPASGEPLSGILGLDATPVHDSLLGVEIGGVRIVRLIAQGGMGRVYEGRQERPGRTVAVKVMRPGLATPSMMKRFEYEAEILARLRHPGIAQIFSAGVHQLDGVPVPFFVMEYIPDARPLTRYADDLKLSTRARLDLFRSVCDAVAHGHQRGVIHRDLKPSNILVDASGHPKVIDFGVAKATDSDLALTTMQTDVGQLVGTLQYMGPEQLTGDPHEIDVRCDVYALGVVLYELLTGRLPYDVRQKAVLEVMRIVREEEPTPISSVNRTVRRDVAVITGKCLEKDRARRYPTAGELAADVARHLSGEPIAASPPGFIDGVVRLARRHRAAAGAVAGVFAAIVVAMLGIAVFAARAHRQRLEAEAARTLAEQQRTAAETERRRADEASVRANAQLYQANLYRVGRMITDGDFANATTVAQALKESIGDGRIPLELSHYLATLDRSSMTLGEHSAAVRDVAFSPDGSRLATASGDGTARIWDAVTGTSLAVLEHSCPVVAIAYHPDGKLIATGARDGKVRLWDAESGTLTERGILAGHRFEVTTIAFSPDGNWLASGSVDETVRLWEVNDRRMRHTLTGHTGRVLTLAFTPDSQTIASAGLDQTIRFWDAAAGVGTTQWTRNGFVQRLAFTPCGTRLAVVGSKNRLQLYALANQELITVHPGHMTEVLSVAFSSDGRVGVTGGQDGTLRTWNVADGSPIAVFPGHRDAVVAVAFSPDGKRLVSASRDCTARVWETGWSEPALRLTGHTQGVNSIAYNRDGSRLATASWDGTVRLWSLPQGEQIAVLYGPPSRKYSVAFSPDDSHLASASHDGTITVWDLTTGKSVRSLTGHTDQAFTVAFDRDGGLLATGGRDGMFRLWRMPSGEPIATTSRRGGPSGGFIYGVAFNPDGDQVAVAGGGPDPVRIFNSDGSLRKRLDTGSQFIDWAKFHPSGRTMVTGAHNGDLRLWDTSTYAELTSFHGHQSKIHGLDFSPDGSRLVTASADFTVRLWDTSQAVELLSLTFPYSVRCVACSPRGDSFATSGPGSDVSIYGLRKSVILAAKLRTEAVRSKLTPRMAAFADADSLTLFLNSHSTRQQLSGEDYREARDLVLARLCAPPKDPAWSQKVSLENGLECYGAGFMSLVDVLKQLDEAIPLGVDEGMSNAQFEAAAVSRLEILQRVDGMVLANEKRGRADAATDRERMQTVLQDAKAALNLATRKTDEPQEGSAGHQKKGDSAR